MWIYILAIVVFPVTLAILSYALESCHFDLDTGESEVERFEEDLAA